ncbi:mobile mystery protein B [Patescibacteria group bacterium]|nr:mobile mystery protein B [Patescibacteria group bacterium]
MGLVFNYLEGETPLDTGALSGLRIGTISNKRELDEFEQQNIESAILYFSRKKINLNNFLSEDFVKLLHLKMFGDVWSWAGKLRKSNTNIGVDWAVISVELKKLLDDCLYWIKNNVFVDEEIAIRLKHRIVAIHPFSNGNGRHSRLLADLIMEKIFKKKHFSWGSDNLYKENKARNVYLKALREADNSYYEDLISFARS